MYICDNPECHHHIRTTEQLRYYHVCNFNGEKYDIEQFRLITGEHICADCAAKGWRNGSRAENLLQYQGDAVTDDNSQRANKVMEMLRKLKLFLLARAIRRIECAGFEVVKIVSRGGKDYLVNADGQYRVVGRKQAKV